MKIKSKILSVIFSLLLLAAFSNIYAQDEAKKAEVDQLNKDITVAFDRNNYDEVIIKTSRLLELQPDSTDIYNIRAAAYHKKGDTAKAIEDYTTLLNSRISPEAELTARRLRGFLLFQTKKYADAVKDLDFVLMKEPTDDLSLLHRGLSYFHLGNYKSAVTDFDLAVKINPGEKDVRRFRAAANLNLGSYDKVIADIDEELKINANPSIEVYSIRAKAYRKSGKNDLAENDEKRFVALGGKLENLKPVDQNKSKLEDLLKKATELSDKEEWSAAIRIYDEIFDILGKDDPGLYAVYYSRSYKYLANNELESAAKDADEVIKRKPDFFGGYVIRGEVFLMKSEYENALKDFTHAISLNRNDILAFTRRAQVYYLTKDYKKAIADSSEVIKIDPRYTPGWFYRGSSHLESGDFKMAVNDLSEYLKLVPEDDKTYLDRARAYRKLNKIKEAESDELKAEQIKARKNQK